MTSAARQLPGDVSSDLLAKLDLADLARRALAGSPRRERSGRARGPEKSSSCKRAIAAAGRHLERSVPGPLCSGGDQRDLRDRVALGYPRSRRVLGLRSWDAVARRFAERRQPEMRSEDSEGALADFVAEHAAALELPAFAADLVRLEQTLIQCEATAKSPPISVDSLTVNPTLSIHELSWRLADLVGGNDALERPPERGHELAMVWRMPETGAATAAAACARDLLVLKMAVEGVSEEEVARTSGAAVRAVTAAVDRVVRRGVVLGPRPGLRRSGDCFPIPADAPDEIVTAHHFTLQWHLTNACDLRCRHCYDRTRVEALPLRDMQRIVEDFERFCRRRRIWGDFCLTGGNPLLYRDFLELYRTIAATDLSVSFLGNPTPRGRMEEIVAIRKPRHFQVSLEGLEEHTDRIRGRGHFARVMEFLPLLRELGISAGVMLTLTRDNLDQVIPLAERLDGVADSLTFNRLAQVGEGADLAIPTRREYAEFLERYQEAARRIPVLEYKDNLLNVLRHKRGEPYTDGCTGFGCGAAFNFIAVLPDGEAHACRKFPSPIGDVLRSGIEAVYESEAARRYRAGSSACRQCRLRIYCGGCMAVVRGAGLDPLFDLDPHCFLGDE